MVAERRDLMVATYSLLCGTGVSAATVCGLKGFAAENARDSVRAGGERDSRPASESHANPNRLNEAFPAAVTLAAKRPFRRRPPLILSRHL
jgi:hypothetical protein